MTHIDDQVAKHIKDMIRRAIRKPTDNQEQPCSPDTLNQVVQALKRGPDPYDLMRLSHSAWPMKVQSPRYTRRLCGFVAEGKVAAR